MGKAKQWTSETFDLIQILPPQDGLVAVYAMEVEGTDPQLYRLEPHPIDLLGLAKVTTKHWEGEHPNHRLRREEVDHRVVGLQLAEGYYHITNEDSNFAGLSKAGQSIQDCVGELCIGEYPLAPVVAAE